MSNLPEYFTINSSKKNQIMSDHTVESSLIRTFLLGLMFLLVSYHFAISFARIGTYYLSIHDYMLGQSELPFQYRILGAPIFKALLHLLNELHIQKWFSNLPPYLRSNEQLSYTIVNCVAFFVAISFFDKIAKLTFKSSVYLFWADFLFIIATYSIFVLNPNLNFILPYDLPSLAFMQVCTLLVLRGKWLLLAVAFAFATLNRETSFIVIFFLASRILLGLEPHRINALRAAAALAIIWIIIKAGLYFLVAGSGNGSVAQLTLQSNIVVLFKPWQWPNLIPLLIPLVVCIHLSFQKPKRLVLSWTGTYLFGFVTLFVVANITEHRAFGDLIGFGVVSMMMFLEEHGLIRRIALESRWA